MYKKVKTKIVSSIYFLPRGVATNRASENLLLLGHVKGHAGSIEVQVFQKDTQLLTTRHNFKLPSLPICIEWVYKHESLCAIGCKDPVITLWDLNKQDSPGAIFELGSKEDVNQNITPFGHSGAVLDLSWNRNTKQTLASGSVDRTLIIWDLLFSLPLTTITAFNDKVQTLEFHPDEPSDILTGCADGVVRLFDSRMTANKKSVTKWELMDGVKKVLWNPNYSNYFVVGTYKGTLHYADKRYANTFLWSQNAHGKEISGICFNTEMTNLLNSTSTDGILKVWNFDSNTIREVYSHDLQMGRLNCMKQCPEDPYLLALGGQRSPRFCIYNIKKCQAVRKAFKMSEIV